MHATTIGLDIAKSVFQVHGEDTNGKIVIQKKLRRAQVEEFFRKQPTCLIGLEACGTSHHWARTLRELGHDVRLIPPAYVKPFVKRNKNDARDAAAICTALGRPDMRFVAVKSIEQQASRGLERSRMLLVKQRTQLMNSVRGQLAEFGIIAAVGRRGFEQLAARVATLEDRIMVIARDHAVMRRLTTIPGIGGLTAHAVVTAVGDGGQFSSARDFAAWCGLTPRQHASAGKQYSRGISRQGDDSLRKLFALGASNLMRHARSRSDRATEWQRGILARRPVKVAVLAQAAKNARVAWALLMSGETYRRATPAAA
jgi:transposase